MSCDTIVPQLIFSAGSPAIFLSFPMDDHPVLLLAVFVLALPTTFAKNCSHVLPHNGLKFGTSQDAKL